MFLQSGDQFLCKCKIPDISCVKNPTFPLCLKKFSILQKYHRFASITFCRPFCASGRAHAGLWVVLQRFCMPGAEAEEVERGDTLSVSPCFKTFVSTPLGLITFQHISLALTGAPYIKQIQQRRKCLMLPNVLIFYSTHATSSYLSSSSSFSSRTVPNDHLPVIWFPCNSARATD